MIAIALRVAGGTVGPRRQGGEAGWACDCRRCGSAAAGQPPGAFWRRLVVSTRHLSLLVMRPKWERGRCGRRLAGRRDDAAIWHIVPRCWPSGAGAVTRCCAPIRGLHV